VVITESQVSEIVSHARSEFPNEACGLLASKDGSVVRFYPIKNAEASPVTYRMDPQDQLKAMLEIDDLDWELGAIYHSHTRTRAYPSQTDLSLAFYPDSLYIIVSLADTSAPDLRAYRIVDGEISEAPLETIHG
jgi:proteasome lid subunit RPN8/RPN11